MYDPCKNNGTTYKQATQGVIYASKITQQDD